jgi:CHAT domain-containing protein
VLAGPAATARATAAALDGARLAHLAAHGSFRADSPLFSSLWLHDGPLYLYDLDRLPRPPHTVVLSACDVGDAAAVGVDEGLGLVTGLLGLGTASVLASTVPVNDRATAQVMGHLHAALATGADLPTAWLAARRHTREDPAAALTAASFTAWGA